MRADCDRYGMPLMVEPLVFQSNARAGGYMVDGDVQKILPLVRYPWKSWWKIPRPML